MILFEKDSNKAHFNCGGCGYVYSRDRKECTTTPDGRLTYVCPVSACGKKDVYQLSQTIIDEFEATSLRLQDAYGDNTRITPMSDGGFSISIGCLTVQEISHTVAVMCSSADEWDKNLNSVFNSLPGTLVTQGV